MNWIEFNKPFSEFVKLGRNVPGALIDIVVDGRRRAFLIGDVNTFASSDNGGKPFNDLSVVLRYKYVWGRWTPDKQSY